MTETQKHVVRMIADDGPRPAEDVLAEVQSAIADLIADGTLDDNYGETLSLTDEGWKIERAIRDGTLDD